MGKKSIKTFLNSDHTNLLEFTPYLPISPSCILDASLWVTDFHLHGYLHFMINCAWAGLVKNRHVLNKSPYK